MIEVRKLIPQVYNQSRDFSVFMGELQILLNELDIKSLILNDLPIEDILPTKLVHYTNIRSQFRLLLKNKGSLLTILRAVTLAGATLLPFDKEREYLATDTANGGPGLNPDIYFDRDPVSLKSLNIDKDKIVYYEDFSKGFHQLYINIKDPGNLNQDLLNKLFYYIKPVNTQVILKTIPQ